ncbi:hypothetical protein KBD81_03805 [Candidatus Woesebacteria bacterium]|nr:hypothetical protein [Candidatus Woesebacteria bacterium]
MSPDTQQNIIVAVYLIVLHNFEAILYSVGIGATTLWALYKPTQGKILILWGFIFLLFAFEYDKHILEPLKKQTLNSLITERQSVRIEYVITKTFTKAVPLALPFTGWSLVIIGVFFDKILVRVRKIVRM